MGKFCTNCGNELEHSWNACPNCGNLILQVGGQTPNKNEMGTNSVQNSTVFSSLDATLDEINSIRERAKKNSENRMKAMKYAITSSIILAFVVYFRWTYLERLRIFDYTTFEIWFNGEYREHCYYGCTNDWWTPGFAVILYVFLASYPIIYYYLGYQSKSLFKGGLFKAESLISSFDQTVINYPDYPRLGEFNIVKSEFESSAKTASFLGIFFAGVLALISILAIFGGRDNNKRY
mgnify:CR=1 FL=1